MAGERRFWLDKVGRVITACVWDRSLHGGFIPSPRWAARLNQDGTLTCPMCKMSIKAELKKNCPNKRCKAQVCQLMREHLSEESLRQKGKN